LITGDDSVMSVRIVNDAKELAAKYNCIFVLTSAKMNKSIHELFQVVAERVFLLKDQPKIKSNGTSPSAGAKNGLDSKNMHSAKNNVDYALEDDSKTHESMIEYILPVSMSKGSCCVIS